MKKINCLLTLLISAAACFALPAFSGPSFTFIFSINTLQSISGKSLVVTNLQAQSPFSANLNSPTMFTVIAPRGTPSNALATYFIVTPNVGSADSCLMHVNINPSGLNALDYSVTADKCSASVVYTDSSSTFGSGCNVPNLVCATVNFYYLAPPKKS